MQDFERSLDLDKRSKLGPIVFHKEFVVFNSEKAVGSAHCSV
jgi:hypothetical protein